MHAFIYGAIAIIVNAVADFRRCRVDVVVTVVAVTAAQQSRVAVARAGRCALRHTRAGGIPVSIGIQIPDRVWIQSAVAVVAVQIVSHITRWQ